MGRDSSPRQIATADDAAVVRPGISRGWSQVALGTAIVGAFTIWSNLPVRFPFSVWHLAGGTFLGFGLFAALRSRLSGRPVLGIPCLSYLALAVVNGLVWVCITGHLAGVGGGRAVAQLLARITGGTPPLPPVPGEWLLGYVSWLFALLAVASLVAAAAADYLSGKSAFGA